MNEKEIQHIISRHYNHEYKLTNSYIFGWESDYFGVAPQSSYIYEIEIKISKSDFTADFKNKTEKHFALSNPDKKYISLPQKENQVYVRTGEKEIRRGHEVDVYGYVGKGNCNVYFKRNIIPNRFYYAVPEELVAKVINDVPRYAGLLSIKNGCVNEIKAGKLLHKNKNLKLLVPVLLSKFYHKSLKQVVEIRDLKRQLNLKKQYNECNFENTVEQLNLFE